MFRARGRCEGDGSSWLTRPTARPKLVETRYHDEACHLRRCRRRRVQLGDGIFDAGMILDTATSSARFPAWNHSKGSSCRTGEGKLLEENAVGRRDGLVACSSTWTCRNPIRDARAVSAGRGSNDEQSHVGVRGWLIVIGWSREVLSTKVPVSGQ